MTANLSPEAAAAREASRVNGRFGAQEHTAPEFELTAPRVQTISDDEYQRVSDAVDAGDAWLLEQDKREARPAYKVKRALSKLAERIFPY